MASSTKRELRHVDLNLSVLSPGLLAKGSSAVAGRLCEQRTTNISPQAIPRCLIQETLWTYTLWAPTVHCTAHIPVHTCNKSYILTRQFVSCWVVKPQILKIPKQYANRIRLFHGFHIQISLLLDFLKTESDNKWLVTMEDFTVKKRGEVHK